jgi:hypothetical protein
LEDASSTQYGAITSERYFPIFTWNHNAFY